MWVFMCVSLTHTELSHEDVNLFGIQLGKSFLELSLRLLLSFGSLITFLLCLLALLQSSFCSLTDKQSASVCCMELNASTWTHNHTEVTFSAAWTADVRLRTSARNELALALSSSSSCSAFSRDVRAADAAPSRALCVSANVCISVFALV